MLLVSEPLTIEERVEKISEAIAGLGQALSLALIPAISSINAAAIQVAIAYEDALIAALHQFEWNEIEWTLKNPHRWQFESLVDWGNRLERAGLLDKYEYRLMYGAECWRALLHSPIWYAGETWNWLKDLWTKN